MIEHVEAALQRPNFIAFVVLFLWGLFIMITHPNMVKKLIGMYIVQTSVLFLLITIGVKQDATVPILEGPTPPATRISAPSSVSRTTG